MERERPRKRFRVWMIALLAAAVAVLVGLLVMALWNWLMPTLFALKPITFWQAIGLMFLGRLLIGGFHGRSGGGRHWRHRMRERWERMTPQEREEFLASMRGRCGGFEAPEAKPTT